MEILKDFLKEEKEEWREELGPHAGHVVDALAHLLMQVEGGRVATLECMETHDKQSKERWSHLATLDEIEELMGQLLVARSVLRRILVLCDAVGSDDESAPFHELLTIDHGARALYNLERAKVRAAELR